MRTPTEAGQYRYVRYSDDGCSVYACCWCDNSIEIREDPAWGWNFCPICGKSWFKRLQCRSHYTPRWAWDRYGPDDHDHPPYYTYKKPTHEWYYEHRSKWGIDAEWSEWEYEYKTDHEKLGDWKWALSSLRQMRLRNPPKYDGDFHYEYRVTLRRKR